jgi:hypothetical protein
MRKYPVAAKTTHELRRVEDDPIEDVSSLPMGGFLSFRHSLTVVTTRGGGTRVKSRQTKLEDGRLVSETLEGEADRGAYDQMVRQAQQRAVDQSAFFLRSLSWLLPWPGRKP